MASGTEIFWRIFEILTFLGSTAFPLSPVYYIVVVFSQNLDATKRTNLFARCIRKPFLLFLYSPIFLDKKRRDKNREKLFDNITVTWRKHKTNDGCFVFLLSGISYLVPRIWHLVSRIRSRDVCHTLCTRSLTFENPGAVLSKNLVVVHGILKRALVKEASVCTVNP